MLHALQLRAYPPDVTRHSGDGAWRHQEVVGSSRDQGASGSGEYQLTHYRRMDSTGRPSAETANHHPARAGDSSAGTTGNSPPTSERFCEALVSDFNQPRDTSSVIARQQCSLVVNQLEYTSPPEPGNGSWTGTEATFQDSDGPRRAYPHSWSPCANPPCVGSRRSGPLRPAPGALVRAPGFGSEEQGAEILQVRPNSRCTIMQRPRNTSLRRQPIPTTAKPMQRRFIFFLFYLCAVMVPAAAQPDRIIRAVNSSQSRQVKGNLHPLARPQYDRGPIDPSVKMDHVLLLFKPSPAQQSDLDQLLAAQQNPTSANFHKWLAPEEFGRRFGLTASDNSKVVQWLQSEGLTVKESGRGNNWVAFSGAAGQVASALRTSIHRYQFNGQMHIANATEPSVPEALADVVMGFLGLDDFYLKPVATKFVPIGAGPRASRLSALRISRSAIFARSGRDITCR